MCGIVGIYNNKGKLLKEEAKRFLEYSLLNMKFRGPDSSKYIITNNFYASGFVRLAIRDLSENGMQPMQTKCNNYSILFNGEIYNTDKFKKNLKEFKINFKSTTDTEIILYHFKHFGFKNTIPLLDGIFALAFFDKSKNELFLARDRAGIKPLYYYKDDEHLIFSSHYNQVIKNSFAKDRKISKKGLEAFFKLGYVPSGMGFFENTFLLPQGTFIKINDTKVTKPIKFYEYKKTIYSREKYNLTNVIEKSVINQLVSDVPVGTFLSGGIDSSLITIFANKKQKIKAFTIGFSDKKFDESDIAKEFAKQKKIELKSKIFENVNYISLIEDNIKAFSEPFSDYSSLPTLLLSKFAKQHVTVSLSGDGGDELFYGYLRNIKYGNQVDLLLKNRFQKIIEIIKAKLVYKPLKLPVYEVLSNPKDALIESNFITSAKSLTKKIIRFRNHKIYLDFLNVNNITISTKSEFLEYLRYFEFYYHLQRILIKVDRASMFHSLETRVPLLSNNVIDSSLDYKFENCVEENKGKIPLRKILKKEVNNKMFDLPKKGFSIPLSKLINEDTSGIFKKYILADVSELDTYLNIEFIEKMYYNHKEEKDNYKQYTWLLWSVFSLKAWYINHIIEYDI